MLIFCTIFDGQNGSKWTVNKGTIGNKSNMHIPESEIRKANFTIPQNSSFMSPYMDEHMNIIRSENPGKSKAWIPCHHIDSFVVCL